MGIILLIIFVLILLIIFWGIRNIQNVYKNEEILNKKREIFIYSLLTIIVCFILSVGGYQIAFNPEEELVAKVLTITAVDTTGADKPLLNKDKTLWVLELEEDKNIKGGFIMGTNVDNIETIYNDYLDNKLKDKEIVIKYKQLFNKKTLLSVKEK